MDYINIIISVYVLVAGLCIGSFLNVCIYRLPLNKSIVKPRSCCPICSHIIQWYENIPLLSYIFLMGKCRGCRNRISLRYPMIELLTGLFAISTFLKFGLTPQALIYYIFICALIIITFIDIDHFIIPDVISLPGIPLGFLAVFFLPEITYKESLLGILVGGGSLLVVLKTYHFITKEDGMGFGDVKILSMIGAFLGWKAVLFTIFVSSVIGTLTGFLTMIFKGDGLKQALPYGPFLAIGAIAYLFHGDELISWYFNRF